MDPQSIAHYRINSKLGEGGMGAVYLGTDTKLARDVAIKVLPDAFAKDPDRLARFTREAQVLASLNHPNIATVYGIEERAIIMELVPGPTLADRIAQGPLPLDEALPIARQIADALDAAHEKNVIHRDLKPANVKVTPEGTVKVLDFGLAKLADPTDPGDDPASAPTVIRGNSPTLAGFIMGTAGYMAPEQARGHRVDKRADIWAFGVVLYEMLTARPLFPGDTASDSLASVLKTDPDWTALPSATPPSIRRLLRRSLDRDRRNRLASMADARLDIDEALLGGPEVSAPASHANPSRLRAIVAGTAFAALAIGCTAGFWLRPAPQSPPFMKFEIPPPENVTFAHAPSVSPDGRYIASTVHTKEYKHAIVLRSFDNLSTQTIPGGGEARDPFWSPDGKSIAFFGDTPVKLKRMDLSGGPPVTICEPTGISITTTVAGTWSRDGIILFSTPNGLFQVSASGGVATTPPVSPGMTRTLPQFLPDGKHYLFRGSAQGKTGVWIGSTASGEATFLVNSSSQGVFAPVSSGATQGYLLYRREQTLMAQPFDASRRQFNGEPFPVAARVAGSNNAAFSAAGTGAIAYKTGSSDVHTQVMRVDRSGGFVPITEPGAFAEIAASPDGKLAVLAEGNLVSADGRELWILDLERKLRTRFTFHPGTDSRPVWSPDSTRVAFSTNREGVLDLYVKPASGGGPELPLLKTKSAKSVSDWSSDGRFILYDEVGGKTNRDIWVLPMTTGDRTPRPYIQSEFGETSARFSPDGNYVAYVSNETGQPEIYIRPFPDSAKGKWQVSSGGGGRPLWSRDGKELYYLSSSRQIVAVRVKLGPPNAPAVHFDPPQPLFNSRTYGAPVGSSQRYTPLPDGSFLVISDAEESDNAPLTVHLNWK